MHDSLHFEALVRLLVIIQNGSNGVGGAMFLLVETSLLFGNCFSLSFQNLKPR